LLLPRSDSKTVSVDSHRQYDSGGLSSESRGNSLLFSVSSMQRNSVAMRQSPDSALLGSVSMTIELPSCPEDLCVLLNNNLPTPVLSSRKAPHPVREVSV
jgi:hypothetical protein